MTEQRFTFDRWAGDYDAYRPGYPDALFTDLFVISPANRPVLEIGCGTGKATEGLLRSGRAVTAIEPGEAMIEQARRRTGAAPVRFVQSTFEDWVPEGGPFGLIACAQAWHWVDPVAGFEKAANLLAAEGLLALFGNEEVSLPDNVRQVALDFHARLRRVPSVRYGGGVYQPGGQIDQSFRSATAFEAPTHRAYRRTSTHTPESYTALTATYSDVQAQPPEHRDALLSDMRRALTERCDSFEVEVETHLYWARRKL